MQEHVNLISNVCSKAGIKHVVICPGSRSAPLVYAFTGNPAFTCYSIIDERSAGYIALGMARESNAPVVLICTSGTAALNFYPAIAEAFFQQIPLLVLTADRPGSFLFQQDGQMINQMNVFEKNILASFSTPDTTDPIALSTGTEKIIEALRQKWRELPPGPIHINIPLYEPLYPSVPIRFEKRSTPQVEWLTNPASPLSEKAFKKLTDAWKNAVKKVVLIGQYPVDNELFTSLYRLSKRGDVVILSDVLSNQHSVATALKYDFIISHSNQKTLSLLQPDMIVSMGGSVLSKSLKQWLKSQKPTHHFRIDNGLHKIDTYKNVTSSISASTNDVLIALLTTEENIKGVDYKNLWVSIEQRAKNALQRFLELNPESELGIMAELLKNLPDAINLHLSNSSSIRYASLLGQLNPSWTLFGNRGTSGIDGCTSTAVGAALISKKLTVLITGDLGFLYDRNALWHHHIPDNLRIIVVNNHGGGIFGLIDGPASIADRYSYFTTPHQQSVKNTALENGLSYFYNKDRKKLKEDLVSFLKPNNKAAVLEIDSNLITNAKAFRRFKTIQL